MRINGEWLLFEDGVVRPVIRGEILGGNGLWIAAEFLVDSGADRTVFSASVLGALRLQPITTQEGVGVVRREGIRSFFAASMPPSPS
jgi:hypothetical protein